MFKDSAAIAWLRIRRSLLCRMIFGAGTSLALIFSACSVQRSGWGALHARRFQTDPGKCLGLRDLQGRHSAGRIPSPKYSSIYEICVIGHRLARLRVLARCRNQPGHSTPGCVSMITLCIRRTRAAQSPHEAPHALIAAREPMPSQMAGLKRYCSTVSNSRDRSEAWASAPHRWHEYTMSHPRALISVPTWPPFCQRARPVAPRTCPNLFRMVHFGGRNQDPMQESASIN